MPKAKIFEELLASTPSDITISDNPGAVIPKQAKVGDFLVVRYERSSVGWLPWESWHHAALISSLNPLTIIEAGGKENYPDGEEGPFERVFAESKGFGSLTNNNKIIEMKWVRPIFPSPIREIDKSGTGMPRSARRILTEDEARTEAVKYARKQTKNQEPYSIMATKWDENEWYCSLLVYKAYTRTIGLYLEKYDDPLDVRGGPRVTPADLLMSPRSYFYHTFLHIDWVHNQWSEQQ